MLRSLGRNLRSFPAAEITIDRGCVALLGSHAPSRTWQLSRDGLSAIARSSAIRKFSVATSKATKNCVSNEMGQMGRMPAINSAFWSSRTAARRQRWSSAISRRTYSSMPPDTVIYSIMFVNFGVFMAWQQPSLRRFMSTHFITSYRHLRSGYVHTLLTHAVSHNAPMHLFSNMFTFYFFGSSLGGIIGSTRLLQLYAASAVTGGLAQSYFDKRSAGLGASAAVNAIVIFSVLLNPTATYLIYGIVPAPAWLLGMGWLAYDGWGAYKGGGNVAYLAHLGGAAVGAAGFAALASGVW